MDIQVDVLNTFEKSYKRLSRKDQLDIERKINALIGELKLGHTSKLYRTRELKFPEGFDVKKSTLYVFRPSMRQRIILTIDQDVLNNQKRLTLIEITDHENLSRLFSKMSNNLYSHGRSNDIN